MNPERAKLFKVLDAINDAFTADVEAWITDDIDYLYSLIDELSDTKKMKLLEKFRDEFCDGCDRGSTPEPIDPGDTGND